MKSGTQCSSRHTPSTQIAARVQKGEHTLQSNNRLSMNNGHVAEIHVQKASRKRPEPRRGPTQATKRTHTGPDEDPTRTHTGRLQAFCRPQQAAAGRSRPQQAAAGRRNQVSLFLGISKFRRRSHGGLLKLARLFWSNLTKTF